MCKILILKKHMIWLVEVV